MKNETKITDEAAITSNGVLGEVTLCVGYRTHRLKDDDYHRKELNFVKAINEDMKNNSSCLAQIVGNPKKKSWLTEEEDKIVLSTIQWLGTPVGQSFLERVAKM